MYIKRSSSEKSLTARRSNARKSRGPTTDLGRQRRRDASLRHGLYSQDDDKVLRALGEDPRDLARITTAVREKFPFATGFDQELGMCLVKAMWRFPPRRPRPRRAGRAKGARRDAARKPPTRAEHSLEGHRRQPAQPSQIGLKSRLPHLARGL